MGVSTKDIDRTVWAIVEYCRLCDSEGKDVVNGASLIQYSTDTYPLINICV